MKKTNWQKIMKKIMSKKIANDGSVMTLLSVSKNTGICISTLSRLTTQKGRVLDYDSGVKLMKLYNSVK